MSTNRLAAETSPYLLQHAHNPVAWQPWDAAALAAAKSADKPILLSIGYAACHWCHVMERESFEDAAVAALMNAHFVCIKVDREERPDLDAIYMAATMAINNGRGGWPMTVFLTPDTEPFFAGTYFPPEDRHGLPGFGRVLQRLRDLWQNERSMLLQQAGQLTQALREPPAKPASDGPVVTAAVSKACEDHLASEFDSTYGGFGGAPKFPHATTLSWLLAHGHITDADMPRTMVRTTLDGMAHGGMYDHVGGGFARYSVDAQWLVPHFEKMLYDNALLAKVYLEGYQALGAGEHAQVARETLMAMQRDFQSADGGFFSSTDADSEGVEGKFFVWSEAEWNQVLGSSRGPMAAAYYNVSAAGNWEGSNIPNTPQSMNNVAQTLGCSEGQLRNIARESRTLLFEARRKRVAPGTDDKILTAWNGLMIGAMAHGARVLGDVGFLQSGCAAADFVLEALRKPDGRLLRTYRAGKAHLDGYLEDYADLCEGLIDLYEAGADARYLQAAGALAEHMVADFWDDTRGVFFDTAHQHEALLYRARDGHDGATPSAHATAALTLARLAVHLDRPAWQACAERAVRADAATLQRAPWAFCKTLLAESFLRHPPAQWVLVGKPEAQDYRMLWAAMQERYVPHRVIAHGRGDDADLPLLAGKKPVQGRATLYVCKDFTCSAPLCTPGEVAAALGF